MTTLIIGGTGNTGLALAKLLHAAGLPLLVTSRSGKAPEPFKAVAFDWTNASTFENPFNADPSIKSVYLIPPFVVNNLSVVKPFIDLAIAKNVTKFVLLAALMTTPAGGGPFSDNIYQYLIDTGVDYTVLRPTWYMENYKRNYLKTIKEDNYIFSCSGDGKSPFVSTADVAKAAFVALTTDKYTREAPYVFGPESISYGEAAALLSNVLGRTIEHKKLPVETLRAIYFSIMPQEYADSLIAAELDLAAGKEDETFHDPNVNKYIGTITQEQFFRENASIWQ